MFTINAEKVFIILHPLVNIREFTLEKNHRNTLVKTGFSVREFTLERNPVYEMNMAKIPGIRPILKIITCNGKAFKWFSNPN